VPVVDVLSIPIRPKRKKFNGATFGCMGKNVRAYHKFMDTLAKFGVFSASHFIGRGLRA